MNLKKSLLIPIAALTIGGCSPKTDEVVTTSKKEYIELVESSTANSIDLGGCSVKKNDTINYTDANNKEIKEMIGNINKKLGKIRTHPKSVDETQKIKDDIKKSHNDIASPFFEDLYSSAETTLHLEGNINGEDISANFTSYLSVPNANNDSEYEGYKLVLKEGAIIKKGYDIRMTNKSKITIDTRGENDNRKHIDSPTRTEVNNIIAEYTKYLQLQ